MVVPLGLVCGVLVSILCLLAAYLKQLIVLCLLRLLALGFGVFSLFVLLVFALPVIWFACFWFFYGVLWELCWLF